MKNFRKLPIVISAIEFLGNSETSREIVEATRDTRTPARVDTEVRNAAAEHPNGFDYPVLKIDTLEGTMIVNPGDFVVIGAEGEAYPVKPSIFRRTYEEVAANGGVGFGDAIAQLKLGNKVRRAGWNGAGQYLYLVGDMTHRAQDGLDRGGMRGLEPCIVLRNAQGGYQPGWVASQADMLATDWEVTA